MKSGLSVLGFLMFVTGFVGLATSLVGIRLTILSFIDRYDPLLGLLTKLMLIVAGLVIFIISRTDWKKENQH